MIVGLGKTGLSCARFLHSRGEPFRVVDSRANPPCLEQFRQEFAAVPLDLGPFNAALFADADRLVVSPGVSLETPAIAAARQAGVPVTGDIDLFSRLARAPIVAVTGSNGKSTVVSLVAAICKAAGRNYGLGGNLDGEHARPALELLLEPPREIYILELSSFQLETTSHLDADVASILNLSQDHMDRYGSMADYLAAKRQIFRGARQIVVNLDSPESMPPDTNARIWQFGINNRTGRGLGLGTDGQAQCITSDGRPVLSVSELKLAGIHNLANVMAAMAIGLALEIPMRDIITAVTTFPGLPHRCQWVAELDGVAYYNDSKGTNVGATVAAIEGLGSHCPGKLVIIAGGEGKGADFSPLVPVMHKHARHVVLIGAAARELENILGAAVTVSHAADMTTAVEQARAAARPGDCVLLSPACASFDMFQDFTHRGRVFMTAVRALT